eukprot:scaffold123067_cov25-Tisochrysis_lutea.AAC.2
MNTMIGSKRRLHPSRDPCKNPVQECNEHLDGFEQRLVHHGAKWLSILITIPTRPPTVQGKED